jgi:hypothetical protein
MTHEQSVTLISTHLAAIQVNDVVVLLQQAKYSTFQRRISMGKYLRIRTWRLEQYLLGQCPLSYHTRSSSMRAAFWSGWFHQYLAL